MTSLYRSTTRRPLMRRLFHKDVVVIMGRRAECRLTSSKSLALTFCVFTAFISFTLFLTNHHVISVYHTSFNQMQQKSVFILGNQLPVRSEVPSDAALDGRHHSELPTVRELDCSMLLIGSRVELERAQAAQKQMTRSTRSLAAETIISLSKNCDNFVRDRHYPTTASSGWEEEFPIAYSIVMYRDPGQTERLLRAIYQPQNYYCIHVDSKSDKKVYDAMASIASCLPNVRLASQRIDVRWGTQSALDPDLVCMRDLLKQPGWKYLINLTGQEFPLKTNPELVRILKTYDGANDIPGTFMSSLPARFSRRVKFARVRPQFWASKVTIKRPFTYKLNFTVGIAHVTASRDFVEYALTNEIAQDLSAWLNDTYIPDESFFSTLQHNQLLKAPGGSIGGPSSVTVNRWKRWRGMGECRTMYVRDICIIGVEDLPDILETNELFANKFYQDHHPLAYDCLEELHFNKTRQQQHTLPDLDYYYYANLPFVKNARRHVSLIPLRDVKENLHKNDDVIQAYDRLMAENAGKPELEERVLTRARGAFALPMNTSKVDVGQPGKD